MCFIKAIEIIKIPVYLKNTVNKTKQILDLGFSFFVSVVIVVTQISPYQGDLRFLQWIHSLAIKEVSIRWRYKIRFHNLHMLGVDWDYWVYSSMKISTGSLIYGSAGAAKPWRNRGEDTNSWGTSSPFQIRKTEGKGKRSVFQLVGKTDCV